MFNNWARQFGGAIYAAGYADTTVLNSTLVLHVSNDSADYSGDQIYNLAAMGSLTISNTQITIGQLGSGMTTKGPTNIFDSVNNQQKWSGSFEPLH